MSSMQPVLPSAIFPGQALASETGAENDVFSRMFPGLDPFPHPSGQAVPDQSALPDQSAEADTQSSSASYAGPGEGGLEIAPVDIPAAMDVLGGLEASSLAAQLTQGSLYGAAAAAEAQSLSAPAPAIAPGSAEMSPLTAGAGKDFKGGGQSIAASSPSAMASAARYQSPSSYPSFAVSTAEAAVQHGAASTGAIAGGQGGKAAAHPNVNGAALAPSSLSPPISPSSSPLSPTAQTIVPAGAGKDAATAGGSNGGIDIAMDNRPLIRNIRSHTSAEEGPPSPASKAAAAPPGTAGDRPDLGNLAPDNLAEDMTGNISDPAARNMRSSAPEHAAATVSAAHQMIAGDHPSRLGILNITSIDEGQAVMSRSLDLARGDMWLNELARDIVASRESGGRLNFSLTPENLGQLDVDIAHGDDGLSLRLMTSSEEASKLLGAAQSRLAEELRSQGVKVADAQISERGRADGGGADRGGADEGGFQNQTAGQSGQRDGGERAAWQSASPKSGAAGLPQGNDDQPGPAKQRMGRFA